MNIVPNIYIGGHFVLKLLSEHTQTHTPSHTHTHSGPTALHGRYGGRLLVTGLQTTRHKTGHFRDVLPSNSLKLRRQDQNQQKNNHRNIQ